MSGIDWRVFAEDFAREAAARGFVGHRIVETESGEIRGWTKGQGKPLVYLSAGIHGDEPAGPLALLNLMREGAFVDGLSWAVVPMLNPDGLQAGTRENAAGVDMNRDYLQRRTAEVLGHVEWLQTMPVPDVFVSLHEDWETGGFYLYEIRHGQARPEVTRRLLVEARNVFPLEAGPLIDGHRVREVGWIYHGVDADEPQGWPEAIYLSHHGCPLSYTLETPSQAELGERVKCHMNVVKQLISCLLHDFKSCAMCSGNHRKSDLQNSVDGGKEASFSPPETV